VKLHSLQQNIPLRRLGTPEDIAPMVVFLASAAADYVTGATYYVDGGLIRNYHEQ
jgi:glucose 1-dehydrogenase